MYARYEVTFGLQSPFVSIDRRTTLDAVLSYYAVEELKAEGVTDESRLIEAIGSLPIRKISYDGGFFYAASIPEFPGGYMPGGLSIVKAASSARYAKCLPDEDVQRLLDNKMLDMTRTAYRPFIVNLDTIQADKIRFVADVTDLGKFKSLIEQVGYIGKKRALGFGMVKGAPEIKKTRKQITRHIPVNAGIKYDYPVYMIRPMPPYWHKKGKVLCGTARL